MNSLVGRPAGAGAGAPPPKRVPSSSTTNIPRSPPKPAARTALVATTNSSIAAEPPRKAGRLVPPSTAKRAGLPATNATKAGAAARVGGTAGIGGGPSIGRRVSGGKQERGEGEPKTAVRPARALLSSAAASGLKAPATATGGKVALSRPASTLAPTRPATSTSTLPRRLPSTAPALAPRSVSATTSPISDVGSTPRTTKPTAIGSPRTLRAQTTLLSSAAAASATSTARKEMGMMQRVPSSGASPVTARKVSAPLKASAIASTSARPMDRTPPRAPRLPSLPPPTTSRPNNLKRQPSAIPTARTKKVSTTDSLDEGQSIRSMRSFGSEMSDQGISIAAALRAGKPPRGRKENASPATATVSEIPTAHLVAAALAKTESEAGDTSWETVAKSSISFPSLAPVDSLSTPLKLPSRSSMSYLSPTFSPPPRPSPSSLLSPTTSLTNPSFATPPVPLTTPRPRPHLIKRSTRDSASLEEILKMSLASARKGDEGEWLCDEGFSISMRREMEGVGTPWRRSTVREEGGEGEAALEGEEAGEGDEEMDGERKRLEEEKSEWEERKREERKREERKREEEEERRKEVEEEMERRREGEEELERLRGEVEREREVWRVSSKRERDELEAEKSRWKDKVLDMALDRKVADSLESQIVLAKSQGAFATAGASWREVIKGVQAEREDLRLLAEMVGTLSDGCLALWDAGSEE